MLDILSKLISFPSVTGDAAAIKPALDYIDEFLGSRGMHVTRYEFDGFESLVATTQSNTKTPAVMLAGHLDVVPANADHFKLVQKDGKLYGRGTLDMKSAIAGYLQLVDDLKDKLDQYDFGVMITTDEEFISPSGVNGTAYLVKEGWHPQVCVLPDGGREWNIEARCKGAWHIELTTAGRGAHGSRPWEGDNAIDKLMALLEELKAFFPDQGPETNTQTIGTIEGGTATNQIPDFASATIDIRYLTKEDGDQLRSSVQALADKYGAKLETIKDLIPGSNPIETPLIATFKQCIEKAIGKEIVGVTSYGANDSQYFNAIGVPCIIYYPYGGGHHGPEEWIGEEVPEQICQVMTDYIEQTARISN